MLNVILIVLLYNTECLHILNTLLQLYAKCPFSQKKKKYIYIYINIYMHAKCPSNYTLIRVGFYLTAISHK